MNESILAMLNQKFNNGQVFGQQGTFAEMQGNYFVAAQNYDQSIWWIYQSMAMAQHYGVQIPHHIYYAYAFVHFSAARAKSLLGQAPVAFSHLNNSIAALNQAISINPNIIQYHIAAGTVLMTLGNFPEAERAFNAALQMNPSEPWSQYMLAVLNSMRGNINAANSYFAAIQRNFPGSQIPNIPSTTITGQGNWLDTFNKIVTLLNNAFNLWGNIQDMMGHY